MVRSNTLITETMIVAVVAKRLRHVHDLPNASSTWFEPNMNHLTMTLDDYTNRVLTPVISELAWSETPASPTPRDCLVADYDGVRVRFWECYNLPQARTEWHFRMDRQ